MGKNIFEKTCLVFGLRPSVSICSASAKNVHFGASLIIIAVIYERKAEHFIVFFTVKKHINNASKNASCYEAIFVIINTNSFFLFVICPINDNTIFRFKQFFDRFLK